MILTLTLLAHWISAAPAPGNLAPKELHRSLLSSPEIYVLPNEIDSAFDSSLLSSRLNSYLKDHAITYFRESLEGVESLRTWVEQWPEDLRLKYPVDWEQVLDPNRALTRAEKVVLISGFTLTYMDGLRRSESEWDRGWAIEWELRFEQDFETFRQFLEVNLPLREIALEWAQLEIQKFKKDGGKLWNEYRKQIPGVYASRELKGSLSAFEDLDRWVKAGKGGGWEARHLAALWLADRLLVLRPEALQHLWTPDELEEVREVVTSVQAHWSEEALQLALESSKDMRLKAAFEKHQQDVFEAQIPYFAGSALSLLVFVFLSDYPRIQLNFSRLFESLELQKSLSPAGSPAHTTAFELQKRMARMRAHIEHYAEQKFGREGWEKLKPLLDRVDQLGEDRVRSLQTQCATALSEGSGKTERAAYRRFRRALREIDRSSLANDKVWEKSLKQVYAEMRDALGPHSRSPWKRWHLNRLQNKVKALSALPKVPPRGKFLSRLGSRVTTQWNYLRNPWRIRSTPDRYVSTLPGEGAGGYLMGLNARSLRWLAPLTGTSLFLKGLMATRRSQDLETFEDSFDTNETFEVTRVLAQQQLVSLSDAIQKAFEEMSPDGGRALNERRRQRGLVPLEFVVHPANVTSFNKETGRAEKVYVLVKKMEDALGDSSQRLELARHGILMSWKRVDSEEEDVALKTELGLEVFVPKSSTWVFEQAALLTPGGLGPAEDLERAKRVRRAIGFDSFFADNPEPPLLLHPETASLLMDPSLNWSVAK